MEVDDELIYRGRRWAVRGFTRRGTAETHVYLQDMESEWITVPLAEIEPRENAAGAGEPGGDTPEFR